MKLRVHKNSLRLRLGPSEIARLFDAGRIEERIRFAPHENAALTYALELASPGQELSLRHRPMEITVLLARDEARRWADGEQVGISGEIDIGQDKLELLVEKDFACIDREGGEEEDTFPNPKAGATC
ncbi:MAG: hypothetical protein WBE76_08125 [Terracidiphilus sp.]